MPVPLRSIRLLTISKHGIVRSALRHLLCSEQEIDIIAETENLDQAQDAIHRLHPDVVLLETVAITDARVPQFIETAEHVEKSHVVILANCGDASMLRCLLKAGLTAYVLKTSRDVDLLMAVRSAVDGKKFIDAKLVEALAFEPEPTLRKDPKLSLREMQVLKEIVLGHTGSEIAFSLAINAKTVQTYRSRIYKKLATTTRAGLVSYAASTGLISLDAIRGARLIAIPDSSKDHLQSEEKG